MLLPSVVLGVVVIARNGDRLAYYPDTNTYAGAIAETTPLGQVQSYQLGTVLRTTYLDRSSPSFIIGMSSDLVDNKEIKVRAKAGVEGTVVFDSAIALLQGLFPPNPDNKIVLANETVVIAPLGGYQYIPVETAEPGKDSLESWTNCAAFEKHTRNFYDSPQFKAKAKDAQPFLTAVKDFVFGRPTTLENAWNIYDFINTQLTHNRIYARSLPPTFREQAHHFADFHAEGVFSDKDLFGIGNIAGRTLLHTIITSLERISFNGDPLQFLLIQTTHQSFVSLSHLLAAPGIRPQIEGIPDYASALAIELRRGPAPDLRNFLRVRFKNGTGDSFHDVSVFGNLGDIPLSEFSYVLKNAAVSDEQLKDMCKVV